MGQRESRRYAVEKYSFALCTRLLYLERFYSRQTIQCTSAVESVRYEPWSICRLGVIGNDYEVRGLQVAGAMFVENFLVT